MITKILKKTWKRWHILVFKIIIQYFDDISLKSEYFFMEKIVGILAWVPTIFKKCPLFISNKLNKLQIKLLWVFTNYNKVLGSIKNKKFLKLSDPLTLYIIYGLFVLYKKLWKNGISMSIFNFYHFFTYFGPFFDRFWPFFDLRLYLG